MKSRRRRVRRKRTRGGGLFGGEIVEYRPMMIDPNNEYMRKREELRMECMRKTNKKLKYKQLIRKCGNSNAMWNPSLYDQYVNDKQPQSALAYFSSDT